MTQANRKKLIGIIFTLAAAIIGILYGGYAVDNNGEATLDTDVSKESLMTVTFVNVEQGDCSYIKFPDNSFMLIDSGEAQYADKVISMLEADGCTKIDTLVITHPHTDHMGGMAQIIDEFEIGEIYMPRTQADTRAYLELLQTISDNNLDINAAKAGDSISFCEGVSGEFLSPKGSDYSELNNFSAVLKLTYNDVSFLFTGDAETPAEDEMLENYYTQLDSDVLKVAHHGSSGASCKEFLTAVSPDYAVIGCGQNNRYGHPHNETITRLENCGAKIYRTDINGDIAFVTDGTAIEVEE